jgi:DNA-binding NarL/FixJ family response regulator
MTVLLIDDHPLFRQALAATLAQIAGARTVLQFETLRDAKAALSDDTAVSLILLDLKLPDSAGIGGLLSLKAEYPDISVAIVSATDDPDTVQTTLACGAAGFISKSVGVDELSAAVEALLAGQSWFPDAMDEDAGVPLSETQTRILDGVHRGLMNKQIAFETQLSEATVKYHLTGLYRRFGVQTRAQLTAMSRDRPTVG